MDENKRQELHRIGYMILGSCGTCKHGDFPNNDWGSCEVHTYEHLKHTGDRRHLSIHRSGWCKSFTVDAEKTALLGPFQEYLAKSD